MGLARQAEPNNEENSILITIKQKLGVMADDTAFDTSIITNINSALMILRQLGVGPVEGFRITGNSETWKDFIGERVDIEGVKDFIYMKTRVIFDTPSGSGVLQAVKDEISELEFRLNIEAE